MVIINKNCQQSDRQWLGCIADDLTVDRALESSVFLCELHDDRAAFDAHLPAAYFKRFNAAVGPMVASTAVRLLNLVS